jgi:hypothetical protein
MIDDVIAIEQRLIQGYRAQTPLYDRALEMLAPGEATFRVEDLNAILRDIGALDAALAKDKSAWHASGRQPGPQLREALDGVTERIRSLAALVDRRVADLQARKKALLPEVDQCIQQRRMLHAYAKSQ